MGELVRILILFIFINLIVSCKSENSTTKSSRDVFSTIEELENSSFDQRSNRVLSPKKARKIQKVIKRLRSKLVKRKPRFLKKFERKCKNIQYKLENKKSIKFFKKELWTNIVNVCLEAGFSDGSVVNVEVWNKNLIANGGGSSREEQTVVSFPDANQTFSKILMSFELGCPNDKCDWWDRLGSVFIQDSEGKKIEISRFITPYRVGAEWQIDVTDLRPLLTGSKTMSVFIDTWASPGSENGDGWLVTVKFNFFKGNPVKPVKKVLSIISPRYSDEYGRGSAIDIISDLRLREQTSSDIKVVSFITGHGQGNTDYCAEFCPKDHAIFINGSRYKKKIWRDDCDRTITLGPQKGNMDTPRAGWCPGSKVDPWIISTSVNSVNVINMKWAPQTYTNFKNSGYNGNSHTPPNYYVSSYVVQYR